MIQAYSFLHIAYFIPSRKKTIDFRNVSTNSSTSTSFDLQDSTLCGNTQQQLSSLISADNQ